MVQGLIFRVQGGANRVQPRGLSRVQ